MKLISTYFNKDKLNSGQQLVFLDYLYQCLKNGFSLNASLKLMPVIWANNKACIKDLDKKIENGANLGDILLKIGFSKNVAVQLNMALLQGSLIDCLKQLTQLIRLKNKQIKKLKAELAYPILLILMMIFLLIAMQTFLKTETQASDWSSDLVFCLLVVVIAGLVFCGIRIFYLIKRQDYQSLSKLSKYPVVGSAIMLYVQYLLVYDISILLSNGFSLQQMCKLTSKQEKGSLQEVIGSKTAEYLQKGKSIDEVINNELFLPNSLVLLTTTGSDRKEIGKRSLVLGKTLYYELNLKLNKLVVNVQPVCFLFIGACILGMYLKILMPMYSMMQTI
ncbi:type II secretion system F family protein [uncultured Lactobacillus sp.]|uniref:type II secretion system F family protein n=1 Tax=uncultured Lactobacillus sp. TaxID=153152 RepID=UPI00260C0C70|nr:type II secretion system F family protein [uncultured Lactobacillus sp.]